MWMIVALLAQVIVGGGTAVGSPVSVEVVRAQDALKHGYVLVWRRFIPQSLYLGCTSAFNSTCSPAPARWDYYSKTFSSEKEALDFLGSFENVIVISGTGTPSEYNLVYAFGGGVRAATKGESWALRRLGRVRRAKGGRDGR